MPDAVCNEKRRLMLFGCNPTVPCLWCLKPVTFATATLEHILPRSKGGSNAYTNLDIACKKCNNRRSSVLWIPRREQLPKFIMGPRETAELREILFREPPYFRRWKRCCASRRGARSLQLRRRLPR